MAINILRQQASVSDALRETSLHPVLQQVFANRGIQDPAALECELKRLLPFESLNGIKKAVEGLIYAIQHQEKVLVVGDYDVDGATSTALAVKCLRAMGAASADFIVPDRFEYGYGLSPAIVEFAAQCEPKWIVTVDNGISSLQGVDAANALGINVIVTDHHLPGEELPKAYAIINPNLKDDFFPSKNLAGVGVVFYLMLALRAKLRDLNWFEEANIAEPNMADYLDLVALGTVADMVKLDKNNRILVQQGLKRIRAGHCSKGITALLQSARRKQASLVANDLGFSVGPRLNAAGRLEEMSLGVNCLLSDDFNQALSYARELEALNEERRAIEQEMRKSAFSIINDYTLDDEKELPFGICLMDKSWHQGVVGILASRIKDRTNRPTIVFARLDDGLLKGSARSITKLHMRDVIENISNQHPGLVVKYGGHAMAAGLTILADRYHEFTEYFDRMVRQSVTEADFLSEYLSDGQLGSECLTVNFASLVKEAAPWGQHFSEPQFDNRFRLLDQRLVGERHLKLTLSLDGCKVDAIAFNVDLDCWPNHRCDFVEAVYRLDVNEFRGRRNVQLVIEHLEPV